MDSPVSLRLWEAVTGGTAEGWWAFAAPAALMLAGWGLATLCRLVTVRLLRRPLSGLASRVGSLESARLSGFVASAPAVVGRILYWVVLLLFAAAAVEALPFAVTDGLLAPVAHFLPRFVVALAVLFTGIVAARLAQNWILTTSADPDGAQAQAVARLAWGGTLAVSVIVSAHQIGLQGAGFVSSLVLVFLGAALGAVALAFGVGAGPVVTNILASHYAARAFRVGDVVRLGEIEGTVSRITTTSIVVEADGDAVHIPARAFCEAASVVRGQQD